MKRYFLFSAVVTALCFAACTHRPHGVLDSSACLIAIDSTADDTVDSAYLAMLKPYKDSLDKEIDVVIGYCPRPLTVGLPECTMLNWACDALYETAVRHFTPKKGSRVSLATRKVDFTVANIGGMRSGWNAGDVTLRKVFQLMPFENRLVVLTLTGSDVLDLCNVFASQGGQGVSAGLRMEFHDSIATKVSLNGKPIVPEALYYVATSNYLAEGGDHFEPLTRSIDTYDTGLLIRDLYIEHILRHKRISAKVDGRMKRI